MATTTPALSSVAPVVVLRSQLCEASHLLEAAALLLEVGASPETLKGMAGQLRAMSGEAREILGAMFP
jgi:hypothetical protein